MTFLRSCVRRSVAAVALLAGVTAPSRADFLIDDFNAPTIPVAVIVNQTATNGMSVTTPSPLGLRTVTLNVTSSPIQKDSLAVLQDGVAPSGASSPVFSIALNNTSSGTVTLDYAFTSAQDFNPGNMLGTLNLLSQSDGGFSGAAAPLTVTLHSATGDSTLTGQIPVGAFSTRTFNLADFTGTADLRAVTGLTLAIDADAAKDILLDDLSVTTPQAPVPAPPAAFLALAALPALGLHRALRRKAA